MPFSKKPVKKPGKMVTISKRIRYDHTAVARFRRKRWPAEPARFRSEAVVLERNIDVEIEGLLCSIFGILHLHYVVRVAVLLHQALPRGPEAEDAQNHIFLRDVDHHPGLLRRFAVARIED